MKEVEVKHSGAALNRPAPLVFWDPLGLDSPYSGIGVHGRRLAWELVKQGIQPHIPMPSRVLGFPPDTLLLAKDRNLPKVLPKITVPISAWRHAKYSSDNFPANCHPIYHGLANLNLPVASRKAGWKWVVTVHDLIPLLEPSQVSLSYYLQFKALLGFVVRRADRIVCVSEWTQQCMADLFPAFQRKYVVIPNGQQQPSFSTPSRPSNIEHLRLVSVGRYESYKRLELILDVLVERPEWTCTVITNQEGVKKLQRYALNRGVGSNLSLLIHIDDRNLEDLLRQADIYIHPSLYEGYCLPAAQALEQGTPVCYTLGSAIQATVGPFGVGLPAEASVSQWVQSIERIVSAHSEGAFVAQHHSTSFLEWSDAAHLLANLYRELAYG